MDSLEWQILKELGLHSPHAQYNFALKILQDGEDLVVVLINEMKRNPKTLLPSLKKGKNCITLFAQIFIYLSLT